MGNSGLGGANCWNWGGQDELIWRWWDILSAHPTLSRQRYQPAHVKTALDSIPQLTGSFQSHTPRPANTPLLWFLEYVQFYLSFSSTYLIVLLLSFPSFKLKFTWERQSNMLLLNGFIPSYFLEVLVVFGYYTVCFLSHTRCLYHPASILMF